MQLNEEQQIEIKLMMFSKQLCGLCQETFFLFVVVIFMNGVKSLWELT